MAVGDEQLCKLTISAPNVRLEGRKVTNAILESVRNRTTDRELFKQFVANIAKDVKAALQGKTCRVTVDGANISVKYTGESIDELDEIMGICSRKLRH